MSKSVNQKVTVDEASLTVVGVSLKVVQIGKKQMTLSVFRQLLNEPVWDPISMHPQGSVWGRVNYFWDGCGCKHFAGIGNNWIDHKRYGVDIHIIWQLGSELRRSCLVPELGEAGNGYPLFRDEDRNNDRLAWRMFYDEHIKLADQLFIAV